MWRDFQLYCNEKAKQYLGVSKGAINNNKDTSWWNEEVREKLETKKTLFKLWQQTKDDSDHQAYKTAKKIAKQAVAQAKATARDDFYAKLETASNDKEIFRLAKRKHQSSRDTVTNKFIKSEQGKLLTSNKDIRDRWKEYYTELLNEVFPSKALQDIPATEGPIPCIRPEEITLAIKQMANNKAAGPDDIPAEFWKRMGDTGVLFLTKLFNK
ncbi:unnamed protein product [Euphydryas editha]|uniref:Uncharacterized protein n=1 Tax=Euphydryas editha TaxID=104508 RepID=A0AAU9UHE8_EUPED|nr:unnamed protein product [Euphydryas editha]